MTFEPALTTFGYPILYLGTILEGETFVILSSILCQTGHLEVVWVIATAFIGALSGDLFFFMTGRWGGGKFLKKGSRWQHRVDKASYLLEQHQHLVVFSYRFLYGFRAVIPFLIGVTDYSFRRFLLLSSAGALAWAITMTMAGLICGKALLLLMTDLEAYRWWILSGVGITAILIWYIYRMVSRKSTK